MTDCLVRDVRVVPVGPGPAATPDRPVSLRITGGRVREVAAGLRPLPGETVLEGAGRWAVPGLWDQHVHLTQWAQNRRRVDVSGTASPDEVLAVLARHLGERADRDGLVVGYGFRSAVWAQPATVAALDAVSGEHAVVLVSGDAHSGWLNSRALRRFGGAPTAGPLTESEWFALFPRVTRAAAEGTDPDVALADALAGAAARGVVGVVELEFGAPPQEWVERVGRGIDGMRVRAGTYASGLDAVLAAGLPAGAAVPGGRGLVTVGPLKIISDGSLNTRTAACCEPYADAAGLEHPRGRQNVALPELVELMGRAHAGRLETALHAIGDAALATALDAFAATGARGSVEHAQLVRREDLPRMARLGIRASVQPAHLLDDRDVTERCWPDRAGRCFPLRSLLDAGVELVLGSDAPVSPLDPWLAMAAAVHRSGDERPAWHPEEALTVAEALAASTGGQPGLGPGSRGDVVLLDSDPLATQPDTAAAAAALRDVHVAATLLGGRATHLDL